MNQCVFSMVVLLVFALAGSMPSEAGTLERDSNKDGKIDQIAHLNPQGKVIKLCIDSNADGIMDRFQYYENEFLVRVEGDGNHNGRIDTWDYLKGGKRIRHERDSNESGQVDQIVIFDDEERPFKMMRDSDGDGRFDRWGAFEKGRLVSSTKDTDGDGRVNVWESYQDGKPKEKRVDDDGDGSVEMMVFYDVMGLPREVHRDLVA